jgi:hypothetical protein
MRKIILAAILLASLALAEAAKNYDTEEIAAVRKEARQEAALCSNLAGAEYAKSSPSETIERLAEAAIRKCECLWGRVNAKAPDSPEGTWPTFENGYTFSRDDIHKDPYLSAAVAKALLSEHTARKASVEAYILDARAKGASLGNPPRAWTAVEQMISSCPAGERQ